MTQSPDTALSLTAYPVGPPRLAIVPAPATRAWMSATDQRFANRCLPLLIANQSGWLVLNDTPFSAVWSGGDGIDALTVSHEPGRARPLAASHFGYGILTWSIPYVFRTPPGFNLLARGPANSPKDGIGPLEGMIETDWSSTTFTMNWKITRPDAVIRFEAEEPICMLVPQRRGELERFGPTVQEIGDNPETSEQHSDWAASRARFLETLDSPDHTPATTWQRDYFKGRHVDAEAVHPEHQTRLHLRPFEEVH